MNSAEIRQVSKKWYKVGRNHLPEFGTRDFAAFAAKGAAIAYGQISNWSKHHVTISLTRSVKTAYIDLMTDTIYLSENYFKAETYKELMKEEHSLEELAIAMINGSTVHEALHIEYTPAGEDIPSIVKANHYAGASLLKKFGENYFSTAYNIVEDLYIESMIGDRSPVAVWLAAKNSILFGSEELDKIFAENEKDGTVTDGEVALNILVHAKNRRLLSHPAFTLLPEEARQIVKEIIEYGSQKPENRINYTKRLLELFEIPEGADSDGEPGDGEGSSDGDGEGSKSSGKPQKGEEPVSSETGEKLDSSEEMDGEEFDGIKSELESESEKIARASSEKGSHEDVHGSIKPLIEYDVFDGMIKMVSEHIAPLTPSNDKDFSFVRDLKAVRTLSRAPGPARNYGSVMVKSRLSRIATDGKIFAKNDAERLQDKRMEVIITVDLSGSAYRTVAEKELGAARQISDSLRQARIAHSVYAHTSTRSGGNGRGDIPALIHIYSYDMHTTNMDVDARWDEANNLGLVENYDGIILERLADKFTGKRAEKYIIMLSDGSPSGPYYRGRSASDHTKQTIANIRRSGTKVFAISVVGSVVQANNEIYGRGFNIDASANLRTQFKNLIMSISK